MTKRADNVVVLGGTLTGDTKIDPSTYNFAISNNDTVGAGSVLALGYGSCSNGCSAISLGYHASACGDRNIAIGSYAYAFCGTGCETSIGYFATTRAGYSITIGSFATSNRSNTGGTGGYSTVLGTFADTWYEGVGNTAIGASSSAGDGQTTHSKTKGATAVGYDACAKFDGSIGIGHLSRGCGLDSIAIGHSASACPTYSIAIGYVAFPRGNGSVVIGACNTLGVGVDRAVLLGSTGRTVTATTLTDHVIVSNLAITDTPDVGGADDVLTWNSISKKVGKVTQASLSGGGGGITGATNGLHVNGAKNVALGGTLTGATTISLGNFALNTCDVSGTFKSQFIANCAGDSTYFCAYGYNSTTKQQANLEVGKTLSRIGTIAYGTGVYGGFNAHADGSGYSTYSDITVKDSTASGTVQVYKNQTINQVVVGSRTNDLYIQSGSTIWEITDTGVESSIHMTPTGMTVKDSWNSTGLKYAADYSANFTARSIPDVAYVTGQSTPLNNYNIASVTANTTLNATYFVVLVDTSGGAITITLPASPATGQAYKIKDTGNGLTNNVTISGNGKNIDGSSTASINTDYGALELVYDGTAWYSLAFIN